jgi:hypothetical protein
MNSALLSSQHVWVDRVWEYCGLHAAMMFSATSRAASNTSLSEQTTLQLVETHQAASRVDVHFLDLRSCTMGTVRLALYRLIVGVTDSHHFSCMDASGTVAIGALSEDTDSQLSDEIMMIEKHLESSSFDEFDDFNPRHPDYKSHRRGGSFFNSDISDAASQAIAADLSLIAKMALDLEDEAA